MRLFVAVNLPARVRDGLVRALARLRAAPFPVRWVDAAAVHLTLKFLGEVPEATEPTIAAAVSDACRDQRAFALSLSGFGAFPNLRRPTVVWVGCHAPPALGRVQRAVERSLAAVGFVPDQRPFRPHLTLGRVRRDAGRLTGFADVLEDLRFEDSFMVEALDVMQSVLRSDGARYAVRHSVPLLPA
ncbi:MAG TPA: RNA 2',3'-cyclic phosphodiesterase [Gemmatimonadales bacterium]